MKMKAIVFRDEWLPREQVAYVPPKPRFTQDLHGATSQKTAFFIKLLISCFNIPLSC
jgi:hypothetical protein